MSKERKAFWSRGLNSQACDSKRRIALAVRRDLGSRKGFSQGITGLFSF